MLRFRRVGHEVPDLVTIGSHEKVGAAIDVMQRYGSSAAGRAQRASGLARRRGRLAAGARALERVFRNADALNEDVAVAMQPPLLPSTPTLP